MRQRTKQLARGKWPGILVGLGVDAKFLTNNHGPCPLCGGRDRFRFDDKDGSGSYYCNNCGPGDGFDLLMKWLDQPFETVAKSIDKMVGTIEVSTPFHPQQSEEDKRRNLNAVWGKAQSKAALLTYLNSRHLPHSVVEDLKTMRGSAKLWDSKTGMQHVGVVSLIQDAKGHPVSLHRIYFQDGKRWKKVMPPVGTITGAAVRLGEVGPERSLCVAEGIESGLAVRDASKGHPVWCGISANGIRQLQLPPDLMALHIFADHDENFVGPSAALELAHGYKRKHKEARVNVYVPKACGTDPLDVWNVRVRVSRGSWPQFHEGFYQLGERDA